MYLFGTNLDIEYKQYTFISRNIIIKNGLIFVQNNRQIDIFDEKHRNLKSKLVGYRSQIISISDTNEIFTYDSEDKTIESYNLQGTKTD